MDTNAKDSTNRARPPAAPETARPPAGGSVPREVLFFFLRFLAVSIALYALYLVAGRFYVRFLATLAGPALGAFGYEIRMDLVLKVTEDLSLNPVVFLSLVAALGRVPWRIRARAAVIGAAILTVANAATVVFVFVSYYRESELLWSGSEFVSLTINFFLPILLWLVLLPVRSAFPFFFGRFQNRNA